MFKIKKLLNQGSNRSVLIKKNIALSFFLKVISICLSLCIVPVTLKYVNSEKYGIWLALSSIITWISFFDFGLANGFRNRYAESKVQGNKFLLRQYVSTTYFILGFIFFSVFVLFSIANNYINWSSILNVDKSYNLELQSTFLYLILFVCTNMVINVLSTLFIADQRPALSSLLSTTGQLCALIAIYLISMYNSDGKIVYLAIALAGTPCFITLIVSLIVYSTTKYREVAPSYKHVNIKLSNKILGLGWNFFVIMLTNIILFQSLNLLISNLIGSEAVTQYNVTYKYFNVMSMLFVIILSPYWSAFTDAYTSKDVIWMKSSTDKLEKLWLMCFPITLFMIICAKWILQLWLHNDLEIPFSIIFTTAIFSVMQTFGWLYMYLISGIGKVRIQMIIYSSFTIVSIPVMIFLGKYGGLEYMLLFLSTIYLVQGIIGKIQLTKLINNTANGIWGK